MAWHGYWQNIKGNKKGIINTRYVYLILSYLGVIVCNNMLFLHV